jgi:hypothetical protein
MASFTDILPQFSPYIQELPVQAMVEVGMEKQRRYDEGVQKIQQNIDNVAGLSVLRDIDKVYLQSKFDELGNKLKTVAAGDFSNYQLVNSVSGMTNQIVKDPIIQNAVASTERYRKQVAAGEAFRKEGKSSINRDWDFTREASNWLNSQDVNAQFNGQYKQHVDVNKKVMETLKQINSNLKETDITREALIGKDGSLQWGNILDAMKRTSVKEVTEGQIRTAINAVLDANDLDELASQGRYEYRNSTPDDLKTAATESYKVEKDTSEFRLKQLKSQLLTTNDIGQQNEINSDIEYYQDRLDKIDERFNNVLETIPTNEDAVRSQLYTRNWLDQVGNAFAYREIKDNILTNPEKENYWKTKGFELDQLKEARAENWRRLNYALDVEKYNFDREKFEAENAPNTPYFVGSGDETIDAITSLKNYSTYNDSIKTENDGILSELVRQSSSIDVAANPKDILKNIENYKIGKYKPTNNDEKQQFDQYIRNSNTLSKQQAIYDKYEDQAYKEVTGNSKGTFGGALNQQLKGVNGLIITLPDGSKTTFSPKEIYNYLKKEKSRIVGKSDAQQLSINPEDLTAREKLLYTKFAKRYQGTSSIGGKSTGIAAADAVLGKIAPIAGRLSQVQNEVNKRLALKMAPITGGFGTEQAAVEFKDNTAKGNFVSSLSNIVDSDIKQKTGGKNYDPSDVLSTLTKKTLENVDFQLRRQGGEYIVQVTDKESGETSDVPVSAEFVARNKYLGQSFLNQNLNLGETMLRNNGTTNVFKDYTHAEFHNGMFGGQTATGNRTVTLPVVADLEKRNGLTYPILRMKTKNGFVNLKFNDSTDPGAFETQYLPSLTNDKIIKLFKTQYPNIEQLISQ